MVGKRKSLRKNKTSKFGVTKLATDNYEVDHDDDEYEADERVRDDESIDDDGSEVGWNEEDEELFGTIFQKNRNTKHQRNIDGEDSDEGEEEESDQEEAEDDQVLLSDLIQSSSSKVPSAQHADVTETHHEDDNDDDDDQMSDEDAKHMNLLNAVEKFSKTGVSSEASRKRKNNKAFEQAFEDSPFSSIAGKGVVSMETLLGALDSQQGGKAVKSKLMDMNSTMRAPKQVEKVISDRLERGMVYDESKADMDKWKSVVQENRHAKTLDLAQDNFPATTYKSLVQRFEPMTDMEKEIHMVLVKSRASEEEVLQREEDALAAREVDGDELKARQAELSKVRALMFYEQMKRTRINKIKSKAYRRIRKKQKQRHGQEGGEGGEGESGNEDDDEGGAADEDEDYKRVKERMDMKHKNTGKWAKMAITYGNSDKSLRQAYNESVQLGNELVRKINEDDEQGNVSRQQEERAEWEGEDDLHFTAAAAFEIDRLSSGDPSQQVDGKFKKLYDMGFMKKAAQQQREAARVEAQTVLRELRKMKDDDNDSDAHDEVTARSQAPTTGPSKSLLSGSTTGSKSSFLNIASSKGMVRVSGNVSVLQGAGSETLEAAAASNPWLQLDSSRQSTRNKKANDAVLYANLDGIIEKSSKSSSVLGKRSSSSSTTTTTTAATTGNANSSKPPQSVQTTSATTAPVNSTTVVAADEESLKKNASKKKKNNHERKPLMMQKSQDDLVQMAFAGPDYEADFADIKEKTINEELEVDENRAKILSQVKAGWGDWAGPGLTGISQKVLLRRDQMLKEAHEADEEKRKLRKDSKSFNVVISDRRVKTASKYKISQIPHPFTTREEYEKSIQMPLGDEWNASHVVKKNTAPDIITRAGKVILPISAPKKAKA